MEKVRWMDWPWNLAWRLFLISPRKALFILHSKAWEVSTRNPGIWWWLAWEFCSLKTTARFKLSNFSLCYKHSPSSTGAWNQIQYFSQHIAEWMEESGMFGEQVLHKIFTDARKVKAWSYIVLSTWKWLSCPKIFSEGQMQQGELALEARQTCSLLSTQWSVSQDAILCHQ